MEYYQSLVGGCRQLLVEGLRGDARYQGMPRDAREAAFKHFTAELQVCRLPHPTCYLAMRNWRTAVFLAMIWHHCKLLQVRATASQHHHFPTPEGMLPVIKLCLASSMQHSTDRAFIDWLAEQSLSGLSICMPELGWACAAAWRLIGSQSTEISCVKLEPGASFTKHSLSSH